MARKNPHSYGSFEHIHPWVAVDRRRPLGVVEHSEHIDPLAGEFFVGRLPPPNFGIVKPTPKNVGVALKKGDVVEIANVDPRIDKQARMLLRELYRHMEMDKSPIIKIEQTKFDDSANAGFPFDGTKAEVIPKHDNYLRWYALPGNRDRPIPIYQCNPKVEYLPIKKIEEYKIRLYRPPGLDFLILEKIYYQEQEERMMVYGSNEWSALGFAKEDGGWHSMVCELMFRRHDEKLVRQYYRWDVGEWDKRYGEFLENVTDELRLNWFWDHLTEDNLYDLQFLNENTIHTLELLPDGEIVSTDLSQKSGRLRTPTNNTIAHCYIMCYHYADRCDRIGVEPSYDDMLLRMNNKIYSDDMQGSTDYPEWVQEDELRLTLARFGMVLKEYVISPDPESIHFLGASNKRWGETWVPVYDEERMMYALVYVNGRMTDSERCQRISGLAHNLAFTELGAFEIIRFARFVEQKGRWVGCPTISLSDMRIAYMPLGELDQGPKNPQVVNHCKKSNKMRRSERKYNLDMLVQEKVISEDGKNWLIQVTDPFHDKRVPPTGFPDTNVSDSVVQVVDYQQAIQQSANVGSSNNWDANIVMWPKPTQSTAFAATQFTATGPGAGLYGPAVYYMGSQAGQFTPFPIGGITCYQNKSGRPTYNTTDATADPATSTLQLEGAYLAGACRVVAMGFEVVNSTAEIYRQGTVTPWRQPTSAPLNQFTGLLVTQSTSFKEAHNGETHDLLLHAAKLSGATPSDKRRSVGLMSKKMWEAFKETETGKKCECKAESDHYDSVMVYCWEDECETKEDKENSIMQVKKDLENSAAVNQYIDTFGWVTIWSSPSPPTSLGQATKLGSPPTWEAAAGVYVVATMNTLDNPAKAPVPVAVAVDLNDQATAGGPSYGQIGQLSNFGTLAAADGIGPMRGTGVNAVQPLFAYPDYVAPYNLCGAYFTGLSPQTTLLLKGRYYVERFPNPYENDLVVLAKPSPGFDCNALDIYSRAMSKLPVGVKQGENPLGEWFRDVLTQVAQVASPVAKTLAMIPGVGAPAAIVGNVADAYLGATKKSRKSANKKAVRQAETQAAVQAALGAAKKAKKKNK